MEKERSPGNRALLAIVLFFGFYLLSIAVAASLIYLPYLASKATHGVTGSLIFFCIGGAGIIIWSIVPRPDRFQPPGPRLFLDQQSRLFKMIEAIACQLGQEMPREFYLVQAGNAWVAGRGGAMGFGSRRVMAIGIPLLQTLSVLQLKAVLAHEFGHYYAGDVKLGPWIYKTRLAITRAIMGLGLMGRILQTPFVWYGKVFLKITSSISRAQELEADRIAALIAGAENLASALRGIEKTSLAFEVYWQRNVEIVLAAGFYPPIMSGFRQFLSSDPAKKIIDAHRDEPADSIASNPYDTHPSLNDRIAALNVRTENVMEDDSGFSETSSLAIGLLDITEQELEQELMAWFQREHGRPLTLISWEEVGQKVWREAWGLIAADLAADLVGPTTPADFPRLIRNEPERHIQTTPPSHESPKVLGIRWVINKYNAALADAMIRAGWNPLVLPGGTVILEKEGVRFRPLVPVAKLVQGEMDEESWLKLCLDIGILDLNIGPRF